MRTISTYGTVTCTVYTFVPPSSSLSPSAPHPRSSNSGRQALLPSRTGDPTQKADKQQASRQVVQTPVSRARLTSRSSSSYVRDYLLVRVRVSVTNRICPRFSRSETESETGTDTDEDRHRHRHRRHSNSMDTPALRRQLQIKAGVAKRSVCMSMPYPSIPTHSRCTIHRIVKEQRIYRDEVEELRRKTDKLAAEGAEEWDIKNGVRLHQSPSPFTSLLFPSLPHLLLLSRVLTARTGRTQNRMTEESEKMVKDANVRLGKAVGELRDLVVRPRLRRRLPSTYRVPLSSEDFDADADADSLLPSFLPSFSSIQNAAKKDPALSEDEVLLKAEEALEEASI
ncbi:hypothetical protein EVG20_g1178 [Dentipellis fragilis]|uniref:Tubulin-specific chaperone A n=1 Tax=Dentipellis fragilis TaxID=205917 RepID=A0A4Y9ZAM7_9AGAM|nr:hypothetical protein EVG20_g1178 [Dentipellis fragilis]